MNLYTEVRKEFIETIMEQMAAIAEKHGLETNISRHNPALFAARGCLKGGEPVQVAVMISDDLAQAEVVSRSFEKVSAQPQATDVYKSFDISQAVAQETAVDAAPPERPSPCDDDKPVVK